MTRLFAVWVLLAAVAAFFWPSMFAWFKLFIEPALGVIMFGMGITLTAADFRRVAQQPYAVLVGVAGQFIIMPFGAAIIARVLRLPHELAAGLVLVGSCPGGTASNVMTYLARGDVALSVTMTSCSTLLSVIATPFLVWLLAGQYVPVSAWDLLRSILLIVIVPVVAGLAVRRFAAQRIQGIVEVMPSISVMFIVLIVACVVALSRDRIVSSGVPAFVAVLLHNTAGLALGYTCARLARLDKIRARTIAIEVGMQNSGMGVALSRYLGGALVALPSAIFSVCHNLTGAAVASYWSRRPAD
jgi:BASS family bile acid:Na+ symporter